MKKLKTYSLGAYALLSFVCISCNKGIKLEPADKRPVKSIQIGDAAEAALIEQELDVEIKHVDNNTLYFYSDNQDVVSELENIGYTVKEANPMQTSFKLVKLIASNNLNLSGERNDNVQKQLDEYNIKVLKREKDYWAIYGSLSGLSRIQELGFKLQNMETEVRPRSIQITVYSREDIQKINEMDIDIVSTKPLEQGYVVYGSAFDYQIDQLEAAGYNIQ